MPVPDGDTALPTPRPADMFGEILCFELRQQVRRPLFWVITVGAIDSMAG